MVNNEIRGICTFDRFLKPWSHFLNITGHGWGGWAEYVFVVKYLILKGNIRTKITDLFFYVLSILSLTDHGKVYVINTYIMRCSAQRHLCRSSHQGCSVKKGVYKNFANFTGKHLCWSFFIKLQANCVGVSF